MPTAEDDKDGVEQHLEACAECAKTYAALRSDLAEMEFAEPPVRDALYGKRVWESISGSLPAYEVRKAELAARRPVERLELCCRRPGAGYLRLHRWPAVGAQRRRKTVAGNHPQQKQPSVAHPPQRVVVVVLSDHLDRSERLLVELKHADAGNAEMLSPLRDEARSLLAANRICRQKAKHDDDPALATALDRLDHLLAELGKPAGWLEQHNHHQVAG